jgi:hypothetical protein
MSIDRMSVPTSQLAVDEDRIDTDARSCRLRERSAIANIALVEHDHVGRPAWRKKSPILQTKTPGTETGHLVDGDLE